MAKKKQQTHQQAKAASRSRPQSDPNATLTDAVQPFSAFSPVSDHLAIVTTAVDKQRLTVYKGGSSASASQSSAELVVEYSISSSSDSPCTAIAWVRIPASSASTPPQSKRHKKSRASQGEGDLSVSAEASSSSSSSASWKSAVALGFESGQIHIFDVAQAKVVRALADTSAGAASTTSNAITSISGPATGSKLHALGKDGVLRIWDLASTPDTSSSSSPTPPTLRDAPQNVAPSTNVSVSPSCRHVLVASHSIHQLSSASGEDIASIKATYTAHATPVTHLCWVDGSDDFFLSAASNDPVLYVWKLGRRSPIGTIELEQGEDVLRVVVQSGVVVIVGSRGFVGVYDSSAVIKQSGASKGTALLSAVASTSSPSSLDAKLDTGAERLTLARLVKGIKLDIVNAQLRDLATANLLSRIELPKSAGGNLLASGDDDTALARGASSLQRYNDPATASGRQSGASLGGVTSGDGLLIKGRAGEQDEGEAAGLLDQEGGGVDDERSLEERLRGMKVMRSRKVNGKEKEAGASSSSKHDPDEDDEDEEIGAGQGARSNVPTTSLSLAASLSQALHSADTAAISSLLTSSQPSLIKSTVLRLSGPNAVKLLEACVQRLQRGGSSASSKSRGTVGSNKARGLIEWIKWTLRFHAGYLMSVPGLTGRLAGLHGSLTSRLASHERLLALQGRLELVMAQVELRGSYDVVGSGVQGVSTKDKAGRGQGKGGAAAASGAAVAGTVWKEDEDDDSEESESEDAQMSVDEDEDDDDDDDDDDDSEADDEDVEAAEEEGDIDDVGLDSRINGIHGGADDDDDDSEEEDVAPTRSRKAKKGAAGAAVNGADVSAVSGVTSDESDEEMDDDEDDEDEEDESELDEDEEDDEDDEEDGEGGGFLDDEAEEASDDEDEDEDEEDE
ncbi:unnamed protein product [Jaminaea pallidilutea]